jgi:hypothetical protein
MADCIFDDLQVVGNWEKVAVQVHGFANIFGKSGSFSIISRLLLMGCGGLSVNLAG